MVEISRQKKSNHFSFAQISYPELRNGVCLYVSYRSDELKVCSGIPLALSSPFRPTNQSDDDNTTKKKKKLFHSRTDSSPRFLPNPILKRGHGWKSIKRSKELNVTGLWFRRTARRV